MTSKIKSLKGIHLLDKDVALAVDAMRLAVAVLVDGNVGLVVEIAKVQAPCKPRNMILITLVDFLLPVFVLYFAVSA